ncbi:MAG: transketolase [Planctomycetes bacterium]|nr:transketolase [Planctomycetota bacterium]
MNKNREELVEIARDVRVKVIEMLTRAGSGHPGSSFSEVEILVHLFYNILRRTKENARSPFRDRFVLSKGHGVPTLYAIFAQLGIIEEKQLDTLRVLGSPLQGHPSRVHIPEVEASTGSLGQGLSIAQGMALAGKMADENSRFRVYCMIGDGESQEGQIWEAAMSAPKFGLDNLIAITDWNKCQIEGKVADVMPVEPLADKWRAFGWHTIVLPNGHDFGQIQAAFDEAMGVTGKPTMILAHTIKGKGVSFMEGDVGWHGIAPNAEQAKRALDEIENGEVK